VTLIVVLGFLLFMAFGRVLAILNRERDPRWNATVRDETDEIRYRIERNKSRVTAVTVGLALPGKLRFALRPEGVFDPFARWLRLVYEFQTRDAKFDNRVYVDCDDPALHEALATNQKWRNAIYRLLPEGTGRRLRCANGWLWISSPHTKLQKARDDEVIALDVFRGYQPAMRELRAELGTFPGELDDPTRNVRRAFDAAIVALLIAGIAAFVLYQRDHNHQVVVAQIPRIARWVTIAVGVTLALVLLLFLGRISRTHNLLSDIVFAALPAAFVIGWGGAMHFNQRYDDSAVFRFTMPAGGATEVRGRKSTHYYLNAEAWPDTRATRKVELTRSEYGIMQGRACIDVLWRSGRLGDPWIERFMPSEQSTCEWGVER
jgi:hypothetical protein